MLRKILDFSALIGSLAALLAFGFATQIAAQSRGAVCDPSLRPVGAELGYQWRGDRCEGVFVRDVAIQPLRLVGLQCRDDLLNGDISLHPGIPAGLRADVRAISLDIDTAYQMDRPVEDGDVFFWPGNIRRALGLASHQIAIVAMVRGQLATFAPVTEASHRTCPLEAVFQSTAGLHDVFLGLFVEGNAAPVQVIASLQSAPFSLTRPIRYALPALERPGTYRIEGYTVRPSVDRPGALDRVPYSARIVWDGSR